MVFEAFRWLASREWKIKTDEKLLHEMDSGGCWAYMEFGVKALYVSYFLGL